MPRDRHEFASTEAVGASICDPHGNDAVDIEDDERVSPGVSLGVELQRRSEVVVTRCHASPHELGFRLQ